jgi:hypothetical protein
MLSATEVRPAHRRRRSPYSDKQHYQEYIFQRIEGYKNSIGRDELLRLGDEAASELQGNSEGQFVLTEVLMLDSVDRLISKRLSLRPYRRWRQQFIKLRAAQRMLTHWGLEPHCPLAPLLPRIEAGDTALVVGTDAAPTTYLLAAHDAAVTFIAANLGCVERVESRMATEALASLFESYVTPLDQALPEFLGFLSDVDLVVLDPGVLLDLSPAGRLELVADLQARSRPGGVHVLLPTCKAMSRDALRSMYPGWIQEEDPKRRRRPTESRRQDGLVLCKPTCPADTA